jgi:hypothetical protein
MTDHHVDRIARLLSGSQSRRQALAALAALALARPTRATATQLEIAACGAAGAVCTAIKGCCEGLVCATSTINPSYGVCVTGEGDMVAVSDDLVMPGSEGIEDELAAQISDAAAGAGDGSTPTRKGTKGQTGTDTGTTTSTSTQSHQDRVRARKDAHRLNSGTRNGIFDLNGRPRLDLTWSHGADGSETLNVFNRDKVSVEILHIKSMKQPTTPKNLTIPPLAIGKSVDLLSGTDAAVSWTQNDICPPAEEDDGHGVYLTVKRVGGIKTHELAVPCQEPSDVTSAVAASSKTQKKKPKKRRAQKQSKRGKGK